jgi:uncharacterized membrane protein
MYLTSSLFCFKNYSLCPPDAYHRLLYILVASSLNCSIQLMNSAWPVDEYLGFEVIPEEIAAYIQVR